VRVKIQIAVIAMLFLCSVSWSQDSMDYAATWLNLPQDVKTYFAAGMVEGLTAVMGAVDLSWKVDARLALSRYAWRDAFEQYCEVLKDFGYGSPRPDGVRYMIQHKELLARVDAYYLMPGHSSVQPWQALLSIMAARNVPEWPISR